MAQIGLNISFTGYTGKLLVVWKKATAPLTEVDRSDAMDFPVDTILAVPNLSPEVYNFEFWQSADGVSLDTLIKGPWSIDASAFAEGVATTYEYVVGRGWNNTSPEDTGTQVWADPIDGDTEIVDERYAGVAKQDIQVSMRGTGLRRKDEWDVLSGGGVQLSVSGEAFANGDSIFVTVFNKTSSPSGSTSSGGSDYTDIKVVGSNETVDATYKNKLIFCNGSGSVTTITFPAFSTLADQKIKFVTHAMTGNYLKLQFNGSNTVAFSGENRNVIYLTKGRMFEIVIKNNVVYVLSSITDSGYDVRGKRDFADDVKPHQLLRDGTVRQISDFPGIVEWMNTAGVALITTFASWNTADNKHKYYLNTVAGEFALPNDAGMVHKGSLATPGTYEADQVGEYPDTQGDHGTTNTVDTYRDGPFKFKTKIINPGQETRVKGILLLPIINL